MPGISPEPYERALWAALLPTYEPNKETDLEQPSVHIAFRRMPKPGLPPQDLNMPEAFVKLQLAWEWEKTLVQLDVAYLYNGTPDSAAIFTQATGLTPAKFVQAFMEAEGSIWRFFHLCEMSDKGAAIVSVMLNIWAEKVKRWRQIGKAAACAAVLARFREASFSDGQKSLISRLRIVATLDKEHRHIGGVRAAITFSGSFDCEAHPMRPFCACPVAMYLPVRYEINTKQMAFHCIDAVLLGEDAAFDYLGDAEGAALFEARTGQAPRDFVRQYIRSEQSFMMNHKLTTTEDDLVSAVLTYWSASMKKWRTRCKTKQEVRTKEREELKSEGHMARVNIESGKSEWIDPAEDDDFEPPDPLLRRVKYGPANHRRTAVLYAKFEGAGADSAGYDVVYTWPCHKACGEARISGEEIAKAVKDVFEEDMDRAKAVVPDWEWKPPTAGR